MGFAADATDLIITEPTGAGKPYLACALGVEACRQTYRVLYIQMPDLMCNFENQSNNLWELTKYGKRIGRYQILILDEWHSRPGGGTQADPVMDRIIHNAYEIPANETNLRKLYDSKKLKKLVDEIGL